MRLLHVIAGMDPKAGGVCQAVRSMISGLTSIDVYNEVVCLDAPQQDFLSHDAFPVHALGPAKGPWCYSANLIPWLVDNFTRFDGIIIHGLWLFPGYAVKKALQQYKRTNSSSKTGNHLPRLMVMPHGMLDPYFQRASGRKLKAFRNWIYWKVIEAGVVNNADKVLFTSKEECKLAGESFKPYEPKEELLVGLGINEPPHYSVKLKEAFATKCPAAGTSSYILFLSRIHEKKGLDLLIRTYANLIERRTTVLPKLIIAGPGLETSYGKMIQKIVFSSPLLSKNVLFTGMLSGDAKWGAFYGCDAFILPSFQENFGIAVVEALACERPVLISDKVNIWREIQATNSGIIGEATLYGTEHLLKSWMELSSEKKLSLGQNARQLYEKFFAIEPAAKNLANAIL